MALLLEDFLRDRPVDRHAIDEAKENMMAQVRAHRLRELRESAGLTQSDVAQRLGVSQRQVSKIERGEIETTKLGTIRNYLSAIGGSLSLEFIQGDIRVQVA